MCLHFTYQNLCRSVEAGWNGKPKHPSKKKIDYRTKPSISGRQLVIPRRTNRLLLKFSIFIFSLCLYYDKNLESQLCITWQIQLAKLHPVQ